MENRKNFELLSQTLDQLIETDSVTLDVFSYLENQQLEKIKDQIISDIIQSWPAQDL